MKARRKTMINKMCPKPTKSYTLSKGRAKAVVSTVEGRATSLPIAPLHHKEKEELGKEEDQEKVLAENPAKEEERVPKERDPPAVAGIAEEITMP